MLAAVLDASRAAVVVLDARGTVRLWSRGAERLFGWRAAEAVGKPPAALVGEQAAALLEQARAGKPAAPAEAVTASRRDGRELQLSASCVPVLTAGAAAGAVGVLHDQSPSRDIEQRFVEAQRLEVVDRIAGAIAHDLKNVLSAIKGFAIVASEGMADEDQTRSDMDQILKAAERGAALAQKLLAFSRNPVVQPNVLDLNVVLQAMDKTIRRLLGHRLELVMRHAPGLPPVKADAAQIEQVVVNLVLNARDAMPAGGRLVIETATVEIDDEIARIAGIAPGRYVRLAVSDTGRGIAPETQARMFEPFFTTKEPDRALGLGLPATQNIVRQMGGLVAARSTPEEGTTFTVDIPVTADARQTEAPAAARAVAHGAGTILVVEDDDLVRMLTVKVLRRRGYEVLEASNAVEAIERADGHAGEIHLLLSDVGLPQVSGPELAARLAVQRPAMKVLFMSGYGRSALAERGLTPGGGVLEKPFSPDALLERLRAVLANDE